MDTSSIARTSQQSFPKQRRIAMDIWRQWNPFLHEWLTIPTKTMMDMMPIMLGDSILDLSAGMGEKCTMLADRVGPFGSVLAADSSVDLLQCASQAASNAGFDNIQTIEIKSGDFNELQDNSFDHAVCSAGLMYYADWQHLLNTLIRVIKPGGSIGVIIYSVSDNNRVFSIPLNIISERIKNNVPDTSQQNLFGLSAEGALTSVMEAAGFKRCGIQTVQAPLILSSATECIRLQQEIYGFIQELTASLPSKDKEDIWMQIEKELKCFEKEETFTGPCEMIAGVGFK